MGYHPNNDSHEECQSHTVANNSAVCSLQMLYMYTWPAEQLTDSQTWLTDWLIG